MDSEHLLSTLSLSVPVHTVPSCKLDVRPLLPLRPPPVLSGKNYPALPCGTRSGAFVPGYTITTHVFPAAWPRCPSSASTPPPPACDIPAPSKAAAEELVRDLAKKKEDQEQGREFRPPNSAVLWSVANRIVANAPSPRTKGATLILLHGIGTHKETWEPTLRRLLASLRSSRTEIHEIWVLDAVQHGDSSLINEQLLGDTFDCMDYARDLMSFVLAYLPESIDVDLPVNLARMDEAQIARRKTSGLSTRTLIGVGHSIGAVSFVYPAVLYPNLFSALVLIESFTIPEYIKSLDAHRKNEAVCLRRKWTWRSRTSAAEEIRSHPYYKRWHPDVLNEYLQHGLVEVRSSDETVHTVFRLKTHPFFEAIMLLERANVYESWQLLAEIEPSLPLHWIWGGKSKRGGGKEIQAQTSFRHPGRNSNVWHPGVDHLLPQEAPDLLAMDLLRFLCDFQVNQEVPVMSKL